MEVYLNSNHTLLLFLFSLLIAGLSSYILYKKSKQDSPLSTIQIILLSVLRFLSVLFISLLLLQLAIQRIKHTKHQPKLIIGIDNSESVKKYQDRIQSIQEKLNTELKNYNPDFLFFDSQVSKNPNTIFTGKRSDYSGLLNAIQKNYLSTNIGAVLILGDGIFNAGIDPIYTSTFVNYPIYTVGIGDTTSQTDLAIRKIVVNKTAYLDNYFPVEIDLNFTKAAGQIINLTIEQEGQVVFSKAIRVQSENYFTTENLNLKPPHEGIIEYTVRLDEVNGEKNLANNTYDFFINVISKKQRVLILASGSHPDIAAIKQALKENRNYEIDLVSSFKKDISFSDYDLTIVHQLPDANEQYLPLLKNLQQSGRPVLYILGNKISINRFNNLQTGVQIETKNSVENTKAFINLNFALFSFNPTSLQELEAFPPLLSPFGNYETHDQLNTLAYQTIQTIQTQSPLITMGKIDGQKRGFIIGEGLWRWRIYDYIQNKSHQLFDELIQKTINYLVLKSNEDNFNVFHETSYAEDVSVIMQAELFNESFELENTPDIVIELQDDSGQKHTLTFDKTEEKYQVNFGQLPIGRYSFRAQTKLADKEYLETGNFSINKVQIELINTEANFQLLHQIATKTGGQFFLSDNVEQLITQLKEEINLQTKKIEQQVYQEFISMKWIFFLILLLLGLEWFLRKFWGIY